MSRQLIIFDFDGTLADTWRDIAIALNQTFREVGLAAAQDAQVRDWIGNGLHRLLERAVPESQRSPARLAALYARFLEYYDRGCLDTTVLYAGIPECLARLSEHSLAILSNKPTHFLNRMVTGLGVACRFAAVIGGDALAVGKPDAAAVAHVVRSVGVRPDGVWMVGDSAIDVATGRAAGAHTIGCAWGLRGAGELRDAGVEFLIEHPSEIPPLVGAP